MGIGARIVGGAARHTSAICWAVVACGGKGRQTEARGGRLSRARGPQPRRILREVWPVGRGAGDAVAVEPTSFRGGSTSTVGELK